MQPLDRSELQALVHAGPGPCLSVFMPTARTGLGRHHPARFRKLLRKAEEQFDSIGVPAGEARTVLAGPQELAADDGFWRRQLDSLAVFASPSVFRCYRLPLQLDELVVTGTRFHVRPLLPLITGDGRFFILALSRHDMRLLRATRDSVEAVALDGLPHSQAEALQADGVARPHHFTAARAARGGTRGLIHAHGEEEPDKENLLRYFQQIDKGLRRVLHDDHAPLVLAAVDYLMPIYREANSYPYLLEQGILGNPDGLRPEDLQRAAWAIVGPRFRMREAEATARFRELRGTGRASGEVIEAVPAACQGRIDQMFVAVGVPCWGRFDPDTGSIKVHERRQAGDEDLVDRAAAETVLHRGTVFGVQPGRVPGGGLVAAVYRY